MDVEETLRKGLTSSPKHIPFWYLYDKQGSVLFDKAWRNNQYHYLYISEKTFIEEHAQEIINRVSESMLLVDLGCGNCEKTRAFINAILKKQDRLLFIPVDISREFLLENSTALREEYGGKIDVEPIEAEYADGIKQLREKSGTKLILWFGGLINLSYPRQTEMLQEISKTMTAADRLVTSLDITQDPEAIKLAYFDPTGLQSDFYGNALPRLNRDYGSKLETNKFLIEVEYVQRKERNTCSYVIARARSLEAQSYEIPGLGITIHLEKDEPINISDCGVESSCKYTEEQIRDLVESGHLSLDRTWINKDRHIAVCSICKQNELS